MDASGSWSCAASLSTVCSSRSKRFTRNALDDIECREDDALLPQPLDQSFSEDDAAVGLLSRSGKLLNEAAVIGCTECPQVQPRLQFRQVLPAGSRTLCVLRPAVRLDVQLPSDKGQQGRGRLALSR